MLPYNKIPTGNFCPASIAAAVCSGIMGNVVLYLNIGFSQRRDVHLFLRTLSPYNFDDNTFDLFYL